MNETSFQVFILILVVWTTVWKIYGAWLAAKNNHKKWFVALIVLNTVGILEIFYIFRIAKKSWIDVKSDFHKAWVAIKK